MGKLGPFKEINLEKKWPVKKKKNSDITHCKKIKNSDITLHKYIYFYIYIYNVNSYLFIFNKAYLHYNI